MELWVDWICVAKWYTNSVVALGGPRKYCASSARVLHIFGSSQHVETSGGQFRSFHLHERGRLCEVVSYVCHAGAWNLLLEFPSPPLGLSSQVGQNSTRLSSHSGGWICRASGPASVHCSRTHGSLPCPGVARSGAHYCDGWGVKRVCIPQHPQVSEFELRVCSPPDAHASSVVLRVCSPQDPQASSFFLCVCSPQDPQVS